jgi:prepilin-type processing-associated H-X9-DG protein
VTLIAVFSMLGAVACPAISASREAARRMACNNNLKFIGLALHNYAQAQRCFPPGTVCTSAPSQPSNQYDVWKEAAATGIGDEKTPGPQGTSFLLRILPYLEGDTISKNWNWNAGISNNSENIAPYAPNCNLKLATTDVKQFYCPSRRNVFRAEDAPMMLSTAWTGGATDYGGCAGRHAAFTLTTGYNLCDATMHYDPDFLPAPMKKSDDTPDTRWGIFGRVNVGTTFGQIRDGMSNTFMTGELQRITATTPTSKDGWAIGGPATLFTTGALMRLDGTTSRLASPSDGLLMNNAFFGSPGSDHANGANIGMADGSVTFVSSAMDPNIFALLGSMADGLAATLPD